MNTYSVNIGNNGERFSVVVILRKKYSCPIVAGEFGILTRERAEEIARDYRAQFGVAE